MYTYFAIHAEYHYYHIKWDENEIHTACKGELAIVSDDIIFHM